MSLKVFKLSFKHYFPGLLAYFINITNWFSKDRFKPRHNFQQPSFWWETFTSCIVFRSKNRSIIKATITFWFHFNFQEILSPNYPSSYPLSLNCHWVLIAPDNAKIQIKFLALDLESSESCLKDSLILQDAGSRVPIEHEFNSSLIVSSERRSRSRWFRVSPGAVRSGNAVECQKHGAWHAAVLCACVSSARDCYIW